MAVNKNYISINGKKIPLTNEQVEQITNIKIGMLKAENPFERVKEGDSFLYICYNGEVRATAENGSIECDKLYNAANYCDDDKLIKQRALHETLNRLLWRFSMTHGGDEIEWSNLTDKYFIYFDYTSSKYQITATHNFRSFSEVYFKDEKTVCLAVKEIVKPFMKQHPEFVW